MIESVSPSVDARRALVRRGLQLNALTIAYNALEAIVSLIAGVGAGSVALVGFGADSLIEVSSALAAQWRLRHDVDAHRRAQVERTTLRIVGWCFIALAAYVAVVSTKTLWLHDAPETSVAGIVITAVSVVVMPLLATAKRRVAGGLSSAALRADAAQTSLCAYLSAITLGGLILNALLRWWWADPVAALCMVPIIAKEGFEAVRRDGCRDCC
jgi:divalent metal cation (Fe/Co/Zn/Cd) transporter